MKTFALCLSLLIPSWLISQSLETINPIQNGMGGISYSSNSAFSVFTNHVQWMPQKSWGIFSGNKFLLNDFSFLAAAYQGEALSAGLAYTGNQYLQVYTAHLGYQIQLSKSFLIGPKLSFGWIFDAYHKRSNYNSTWSLSALYQCSENVVIYTTLGQQPISSNYYAQHEVGLCLQTKNQLKFCLESKFYGAQIIGVFGIDYSLGSCNILAGVSTRNWDQSFGITFQMQTIRICISASYASVLRPVTGLGFMKNLSSEP